jgi:hypothetical protein
MKFLVTSDQHLGNKLYNFPELENDCRQLFSVSVDKAIELGVEYFVSVGDLFDNNKPTSETIDFVSSELRRLRESNIIPVAIAGDHSKPMDGVTWEKICGFSAINIEPQFVGVDYNDNPSQVLSLLNEELSRRDKNSVKFIFLHQQIPELFPFCDEKKKINLNQIDFSNHCESLEGIFLGDIHKRKEMWYHDPVCNSKIFVGYCGSLGVTSSDEFDKPGIYFWNNGELQVVEYELPRRFVTIDLDIENILTISPEEYTKEYKDDGNKPVFLCKYGDDVAGQLNKLDFLYSLGIVKFTKIKKYAKYGEEHVNIRSELKTADRISGVLRDMTNGAEYGEELYNYSYKLLLGDKSETVLDALKEEILTPNT